MTAPQSTSPSGRAVDGALPVPDVALDGLGGVGEGVRVGEGRTEALSDRDAELLVSAAVDRSAARDGRSPLHCSLARDGDLVGETSAWVRCCEACHWEYRPDRTGMTEVVRGLTVCCAWYVELGEPKEDAS